MFKITKSDENCSTVYRVYYQHEGKGPLRMWYKTNSEEKAEAFVREREAMMKDDTGEIDPKVRIG